MPGEHHARSNPIHEIRQSDKLTVLMPMLPATVLIFVEVSSNIIIPTTFSDDWISLLGYFLQIIRRSD